MDIIIYYTVDEGHKLNCRAARMRGRSSLSIDDLRDALTYLIARDWDVNKNKVCILRIEHFDGLIKEEIEL